MYSKTLLVNFRPRGDPVPGAGTHGWPDHGGCARPHPQGPQPHGSRIPRALQGDPRCSTGELPPRCTELTP